MPNVTIYVPPKVFKDLERYGEAINRSKVASAAFRRRVKYLDRKAQETDGRRDN